MGCGVYLFFGAQKREDARRFFEMKCRLSWSILSDRSWGEPAFSIPTPKAPEEAWSFPVHRKGPLVWQD